MDFGFRFDLWYAGLPASPTDAGVVRDIVIRPPELGSGGRRRLARVRVLADGGLEGDRWASDPKKLGPDQVSLINVHVLASLAGAEPERMALSGDNFQVDLDLSEKNLPVGTRLELGGALLEVSPQPHQPCRLFHERYGVTAVKKVLRANKRGRRGRGVLCTVVRGGEVSVGDPIRVLREPPASPPE
ncbi:MAG: MOSC domain-containing protein [Planctomycetes bacterium]|nr:MOSC domain-containing protein [Planctomycetota bacterium]